MTLKHKLLFLTPLVFVFVLIAFSSANAEEICCQFIANTGESDYFDFCQMADNDCDSVKAPTNYTLSGQAQKTAGVCIDDNNRIQNEEGYGTHCAMQNANSQDACKKEGGNLKDCVAGRLPKSIGTPGVTPEPGTLIASAATIINSILGLVGLIFTTFLMYAGIQWIHYGGNSEGRGRAAKRIKNSIIGLAITLSAYALSYFIINSLTK
jgi:hypothetical protein